MAELVVTTSLDRSGFDKGVAELTTAIAQVSAKPIKVKIDGDFSKITADVAKVAVAQEKTKQAIEATKQATLAANASMAASYASILAAQEKSNQEHDKAIQKTEQRASAVANLNREMEHNEHWAERQAHAEEQHATATERRVAAEANKERQTLRNKQAETDLERAEVNRESAAIRANARTAQGAREAAAATDQLAGSVNRVSEAFTGWVTRNIWNALRNNLRDALNTMREMDTQLTTIRRVSGASEAEVSQYQEQAYDISSRYGVKPADYLSNVVAYTRAGYGNLSGELAEVTTKLQVVGQVSQDVATQMLLAVDAAYQFEDRTQGLSSVMDGVVAIGDHYATNVEKIAEAIGVVAPIAAQAHVGIDELAAAIGTITADTQRSGTEAARALRYVFLNILQNTTTEIEEGVTLTKEEIEGFQDVLEYFIPDVLALADAEGKVVNPMEALGAIAKGIKEDVIDEAQLFEMLTKVAGKLRASQVLALVNDWDKYSDMVKLFGDSLGETDSKVDVALSSWESKANMLSASFTKLFGNVLNSSMVKGGIDLLKNFVDFLNIGDGVPAKMIAIGAAFSTISGVITSLAAGGRVAQTLSMLTSFFANPYFIAGAAIVGAIAAIKELVVTQEDLEKNAENTSQAYNEQKTKLEQTTSELEKHKKIIAELEGGNLTEAEKSRLEVEKQITAELERQAKIEEYKTESAYRDAAVAAARAGIGEQLDAEGIASGAYKESVGLQLEGLGITGNIILYQRAKAEHDAAVKALDEAVKAGKTDEYETLGDAVANWEEQLTISGGLISEYLEKNETYYKLASEYAEKNDLFNKSIFTLTDDQRAIVDYVRYYKSFLEYMGTNFPEFVGGAGGGTASGGGGAGSTGGSAASAQTAWQKSQAEQLRRTQALVRANKEYNDTLKTGQKFARLSKEACDDLSDAGFDLKDAVIQDGDAFIITREALDGFIKSSKEWYEKYGLEMPDNFKEIAENAEIAAGSFEDLLQKAGGMADEIAGASKALADLKAQLKEGGEQGDTLSAYRTEYKTVMEMWEKGLYGSRELQGFMNLVLGEDRMAALGFDYKKAGEILGNKFFQAMFSPEGKDDYGAEAIKYLYHNVADKEGNIVGKNGEIVASFQNVNGEIQIAVNSFEGLSDVLSINTDVLMTLFDALGMYKNGINNTGNDITKMLDSMGEGVSKLNNGVREVELDKFINVLAAKGSTIGEIFQLIQSMGGMKGISFGDADIKDTAGLYEKIRQSVANANNKDLQLTPDASGWTAYEGTATAAIQGVQERWDSSAASIDNTSPNPTIDTEGLEGAGETINEAAEEVERLGSTEGTGKAGVDTEGVPEGTKIVESAEEALENYNGTQGSGEGSMNTDGLDGKTDEVEDAGKALEDYDGTEGKGKGELDTDGLDGKVEDVEDAGKVLEDYDGKDATSEAGLDTSEIDTGKAVLQGIINQLYDYGVIDETAKANLEADLDEPEARIKIAESVLTAFAADPYLAEVNADVTPLWGVLPTVKDAADTLSDYGVSYMAVVGLQNNIPPAETANLEGLLISCVALDKTYTLNLSLNDDGLTNGDKLNNIKEYEEYIGKLGEYALGESNKYSIDFKVNTDELDESLVTIGTFEQTAGLLKPKYETLVKAEVNGNEYVDWLKDDINQIQGTFTTEIKQQGAATVERMAKRAQRAVEGIPAGANVKITPEDAASSVITGVSDALTNLNGKGAVVQIKAKYSASIDVPGFVSRGRAGLSDVVSGNTDVTPRQLFGAIGSSLFGGSQAEGTRDFPGGRSLVNELGPELIAYGGRAFVAGGGYPTIVDLPRGAMIFDAEETRSIVANSGSGLPSGAIGSHAAGRGGNQTNLGTLFGGRDVLGTTAAAIAGLAAVPDWVGAIEGITGKDKDKGKGKGGGGAPVDNTDYWAIVEAHYKEITAVADNATTNLEYQIQLLKDAWDDEKKPLDEQIKALQDLNSVIDRQITLLTRERDKLTKPIQDEVDALKEAKDIQDDELELEERQKAVEESRAELQNAQNERTIRFFNKETGHWEWMADQKRIQSAQEALESAEKSLADFQYDLQIKALENEIKAIEAEYQEKFDALNADKQENEDTIYDLQQELKELERRYNEIMGPLEEEKEDRSRAKAALENAWTNAQFERREGPTGNLDLAISKTGVAGSLAGGGIKELQADLKTIANAYKGSQQNNTLASLGIQFGATPSYAGTSSVTTVGNSVTDSHDIVINGITLPASAAYQSLMDLANDLSIYVNYK